MIHILGKTLSYGYDNLSFSDRHRFIKVKGIKSEERGEDGHRVSSITI